MPSIEIEREEEMCKVDNRITNPLWKPGVSGNPNGRPKGSGNKLSIKTLLAQLSDTVGKPYEQQLAENYRDAIVAQDRKTIQAYDNLFLSKLLADKVSLEVAESQEIIDQKKAAFKASLAAYQQHTLIEAHTTPTLSSPTIDHDAIYSEPNSAEIIVEHDEHTIEVTVEHRPTL